MLSSAERKKYYEKKKCLIIGRPQWRQFKLRLQDGTWIKNRSQVQTVEELQQLLIKFNPVDAYMSVSQWIQPSLQSGYHPRRGGYKHLNRVLIKSDFFVEIDEKNCFEAHKNFTKACRVLEEDYDEFVYIQSRRGQHIWVLDWYEKSCKKIVVAKDRTNHIAQMKIRTANKLRSAGVKFDYPQSINAFQVARLGESLHHSGMVCYVSKVPFPKPYTPIK